MVLSDGLHIERLPVGVAAGRLWVTFVLSGIEFFGDEQDADGLFGWERRVGFAFDAPNGSALCLGAGGGGDDSTQHKRYEFAAHIPWLHVTYLQDGRSVATELIEMD